MRGLPFGAYLSLLAESAHILIQGRAWTRAPSMVNHATGKVLMSDYRLALDLGTNSIGWCVLRLDDSEPPGPRATAIIRGGVRIFGDGRDPKSGQSLAVDRRAARAMRRNRDRRLKRKRRLLDVLLRHDLLPSDSAERSRIFQQDPYELRALGLDRALSRHKFGRVLFHLDQRRGFKSNRKTDRGTDDTVMKSSIRETHDALTEEGFRTVGEWLAERHANRKTVRARLRGTKVADRKYDLYFDRAMIKHEFDALWDAQQRMAPGELSTEARNECAEAIFFQRQLRPVDPGRCTLEPDEKRAPTALPSSQRIRIFQELNNLRTQDSGFTWHKLDRTQRDQLLSLLMRKKELTFKAIRKALKLGSDVTFNLESAKRTKLGGDLVGYELAKPECFGARWNDFSIEEQDDIVLHLLNIEDEGKVLSWLRETHGCDDDSAAAIAGAKLPVGYFRLSQKATLKILPKLTDSVVPFSEAVVSAGYRSHSALDHTSLTGEILDELPYYGEPLQRHVGFGSGKESDADEVRFGRISNPTVHIALNQLRKVVNEIVGEYGRPRQIVIEVTRDLKLSKNRKDEIAKRQAEDQERNERIRAEIGPMLGGRVSRTDIIKYRLWEELNPHNATDRRCPFTGEQISVSKLFSPQVEVEHILPFSRTLDDSMNNRTVAMVRANRDKGNNTPYEAFGHSPDGYNYEAMLERAACMPRGKAYRFAPDGLQQWDRDDNGFLARALNDTAYISRVALEYVKLLVGPNNAWAVPGAVTGKLRYLYGVSNLLSEDGSKNRSDHRHHAVDAAVIGVVDRSNLQALATASGRSEERGGPFKIEGLEPPWTTYRAHVMRMADAILVSHRPNHGYQRQMNNDTNYGLRPDGVVAVRKPLISFDSSDKLRKAVFADPGLQDRLLRSVSDAKDKAEFKERIQTFSEESGTRRVRVLETLDVIPISLPAKAECRRPRGAKARLDLAYRGVKGDSNYCVEVFAKPDGRWTGRVISTFEAYWIVRERGERALRNPRYAQEGEPLIMRLMRDDIVRLEINGETRLLRVCVVKGSGNIQLAAIHEANVDARARAGELKYVNKTPGTLRSLKARQVAVTAAGRLRDPGSRQKS